MASAIYPAFKDLLLNDGLSGDITGLNIKCALIDTGTYTYSASHDFRDDLTGVVATSGNLTGITVSNGTLDASDVTITGVSGATVEAVVFYIDTGVAETSPLISFIDGLTLTPDGGNVDVTINSIINL